MLKLLTGLVLFLPQDHSTLEKAAAPFKQGLESELQSLHTEPSRERVAFQGSKASEQT